MGRAETLTGKESIDGKQTEQRANSWWKERLQQRQKNQRDFRKPKEGEKEKSRLQYQKSQSTLALSSL